MLHRVDGILVSDRGAVEAAVLPHGVVVSADRGGLWVGYCPLYVVAARDSEALYALRRGCCLLPAIDEDNSDEGPDHGYQDPPYHYSTEWQTRPFANHPFHRLARLTPTNISFTHPRIPPLGWLDAASSKTATLVALRSGREGIICLMICISDKPSCRFLD
jgi:hypothetical protein